MTDLTTIGDCWRDFERKAYEGRGEFTDLDRREMWIAFYCGAASAWSLCKHATSRAHLQMLDAEIQAFADGPPESDSHH